MSGSSKYGRVFDGSSFEEITHPIASNNNNEASSGGAYEPIPPTNNNNNHGFTNKFDKTTPIFVSIPHFRDGKRCAQTVRRLFDAAAHPDRVVVGLIEQTDSSASSSDSSSTDDDPTCLMEYCALMGHQMKQHEPGVSHMAERQADYDAVLEACPRATTQIRSVRFHHFGSKGPVYARSFTRKLLGNEEFCMEIDASMDFVQNWDNAAIEQWKLTNNEYAVLSNVPLSAKDKGVVSPIAVEVPRQCDIKIGSEGVPLFETHADGKAIGITQPLLSRTYSPSFVFSKCHYQTNVPQDPFAVQLLNTEQFPHFARLWTRGYDVYTPAFNLVYKDNSDLHPLHHIAGHGEKGEKKWPRNDNERRDAHVRMKVMLNIHRGITNSEISSMTAGGSGGGGGGGGRMITARANLGIYGLGRRRTLDQLLQFASIALPDSEFRGQYGNEGKGCANLNWVPYDKSISPRANLFDGTGKADDLDLEPEFPLRTLPDTGDYLFSMGGDVTTWKDQAAVNQGGIRQTETPSVSSNVPYSFVFLLWVLGLYVWYASFVDTASNDDRGKSSRARRRVMSKKPVRKVAPLSERALKNV